VYFVTGGSFQGKRKWVKETLVKGSDSVFWINGYKQESLDDSKFLDKDIVVIEGMEEYIRHSLNTRNREGWKLTLRHWQEWEKQQPTRLIAIIGCEIGLGIVPMEKRDRAWRDLVGWVYQDIASDSTNVVRLWCGIAETLKGDN
jgi:adenosyl cobinamide kinase/adenosyl cobinamide phosphate guanylyltransferase